MNKIGLVLSGGGAKGAYEVGVVRSLADLGITIDAISAASIGSLNGAIIAGSDHLVEASLTLEKVWLTVADNPPVGLKTLNVMQSLVNLLPISGDRASVFENSTERAYISDFINFNKLRTGIPLYVSVYETENRFIDIIKFIFQMTHSSTTIKIQDLPSEKEMINLLLASSALPFVFKPVSIGGKMYRDGGLGDKAKEWGNTPIKPLLNYDIIIVVHLSDGSLWSRHDFTNPAIVEIRPQKNIRRGQLDVLGFNKTKIQSWIEQGYEDAQLILGKIIRQFGKIEEVRSSFIELDRDIKKLNNDGFNISDR